MEGLWVPPRWGHDPSVGNRVRIEVGRGGLAGRWRAPLLIFWERKTGVGPEESAGRIPHVVCLLLDDDAVLGGNSVEARAVPHVSDRVFWVFRTIIDDDL